MNSSTNPDTLKGYDMMITVSQDAINKQFRTLYEKEIPTAVMPDPEEIDGFAELPAAKHYINHHIKIMPQTMEDWDDDMFESIRPEVRPENGKFWLPSDKWLEGEIDSPFVTFGEEQDNFRCVRVHLKIIKGSLYFNYNGRSLKQKLDGCTLSWIADLAHNTVDDFIKDIVDASKKKSEHTLVPKEVVEKFKALDEQSFTVTTLFCLFQSTRVVNSFQFLDFDGTSKGGSQKVADTAGLISQYFKALSANAGSASTPNNPFVLGYGLAQKIKNQTDEQRLRAENAPYFMPKKFDLTVTKGDGEYSNGVINYCILTHRPHGYAASSIDHEKDVAAGFWKAGDTPYKRIRADGLASGADGVMAFSRFLFRDLWLRKNFIEYFKVDMEALSTTLVPKNDNTAKAQRTAEYGERFNINGTNQIFIEQEFVFQPMDCDEMDTDKMKESESLGEFLQIVLTASKKIGLELKYWQRRLAEGTASATLKYDSDVQRNPGMGKDSDTNRKLYFDVVLSSNLSITQKASGICNINRLFEDKVRVAKWLIPGMLIYDMIANKQWFIDIFQRWENARVANIEVQSRVGFDMAPALDSWSLSLNKDKNRTTVPIGAEELPRRVITNGKVEQIGEQTTKDGVVIELTDLAMFSQYGTPKGMDRFAKPANQWASNFETKLEENMAALASTLQTKLILPAGNVFEFKSLNMDDEGHVYSLITYKTPTDVSTT